MDPRRHMLRNGWITLAASLALASLLALPGRAGAATETTFNDYLTVPIAVLSWGILHNENVTFSDVVQFTIAPASGQFTAQFQNNWSDGVTGLVFTLWSSPPNFNNILHTSLTPATSTSLGPVSSILNPGTYQIQIAGNTTFSGSHFNHIDSGRLLMVPIPEPETYAMMLAGLGLMGFVARRRKQRQAV